MHTCCPQCQTVFRITPAQIKVRDGMVRCGRCQRAFRADKHLIRKTTKSATKSPSTATRKRTAGKKSVTDPAQAAPARENLDAPGSPSTVTPAPSVEPIFLEPRLKTRNIYWALGSAMLILLLAGQAIIFYGYELTQHAPELRSSVDLLCDPLPCRRLPLIDMQRMDLVETRIAPHPRYDKALRIKATLVNRAEATQPYPKLEISLIDNQGQLVARRTFPPQEYLPKRETIQQGMPPQLAVNVQLDITSPGAQANGYEVMLLPP